MVYINECMEVNTALKKFLQIYELFAQDQRVSKEFPTLASPRLYLVILSNLWCNLFDEVVVVVDVSRGDDANDDDAKREGDDDDDVTRVARIDLT